MLTVLFLSFVLLLVRAIRFLLKKVRTFVTRTRGGARQAA